MPKRDKVIILKLPFAKFRQSLYDFVKLWMKVGNILALFSSRRDISHYEVIYRNARYIANSVRNLYR